MVRVLYIVLLFYHILYGDFNSNCVACHSEKKIDLRKTFMDTLLVYSGENNFKIWLFYYCKNPSVMSSSMSEEFLKQYTPLKKYIIIDDMELKKSINKYWSIYKIEGNLF